MLMDMSFLQLKLFFSQVTFAKPKSSRNSSIGESLYGLALHLTDRISDIIDDSFNVFGN
jgi:hypothetical protein